MELETLRHEVDIIDDKILELLIERNAKASEVARCKAEGGVPVFDPSREDMILERMSGNLTPEDKNSIKLLFEIVMDLNRLHEYEKRPKEFEHHTDLGGLSVRAVIKDTPRAICRYISPLAAADVSISDIRSQALPGGKLMVELELEGDLKEKSFAAAISVLADASSSFQLL